MRGQKRREFRLDRLGDQAPRPHAQDFGERIVDRPFWPEADNIILGHGVTLLREVRAGWTPAPLRRLLHPVTHFRP